MNLISFADNEFDYDHFMEYFLKCFQSEHCLLNHDVELIISNDSKRPTEIDNKKLKEFAELHTPVTITLS